MVWDTEFWIFHTIWSKHFQELFFNCAFSSFVWVLQMETLNFALKKEWFWHILSWYKYSHVRNNLRISRNCSKIWSYSCPFETLNNYTVFKLWHHIRYGKVYLCAEFDNDIWQYVSTELSVFIAKKHIQIDKC